MTVKEILESYEEITVEEQVLEGVLFFTLFEKKFLFFAPDEDDPSSKAAVYLYNDDLLDFPHVMLRENTITEGKDLPNGTYRWICLFEQESIVNTIVSYEDKIFDCVDRLIELLSMTPVEREREFQKEFMYYWNNESVGDKEFSVYLEQATQFTELDAFYGSKKVRLIQKGLKLTDIDDREKSERKWIHHIENDVFYIPVTDNRGILPPHRGYQWTANEVQGIVYGKQIEHISDETFRSIKSVVPKTQDVILVFGMRTALLRAFTAIVLHAVCGVFMGCYYGSARQSSANRNGNAESMMNARSILIPVLIHGFYDFTASQSSTVFTVIFFIFLIFLYYTAYKRINALERSDTPIQESGSYRYGDQRGYDQDDRNRFM